jgi:hypothetical protein
MGSMPAKSARSSNKVRKLVSFGIPNSVRGKAWVRLLGSLETKNLALLMASHAETIWRQTYLSEANIRRQEGLYHDLCMREDLPESDQIDDDVSFCL